MQVFISFLIKAVNILFEAFIPVKAVLILSPELSAIIDVNIGPEIIDTILVSLFGVGELSEKLHVGLLILLNKCAFFNVFVNFCGQMNGFGMELGID